MRQFYRDTIVVKRLKGATSGVMRYIATSTSEACIQPMGKQRGQMDVGQYGSTFIAYLPIEISVNESDKVKDQFGIYYTVVNVEDRTTFGALAYKELILKKS